MKAQKNQSVPRCLDKRNQKLKQKKIVIIQESNQPHSETATEDRVSSPYKFSMQQTGEEQISKIENIVEDSPNNTQVSGDASSPESSEQDNHLENMPTFANNGFHMLTDETISKWTLDMKQLFLDNDPRLFQMWFYNIRLQNQIREMEQEFDKERRRDQFTIANLNSLVNRLLGKPTITQNYQSLQFIGLPSVNTPTHEQPLPGFPNNLA